MKPITCINCDTHFEIYEHYKKTIKRMIKTIPKTTLINILVEMKILKQDYLTRECSLKQNPAI
jgi:hypothetical protein